MIRIVKVIFFGGKDRAAFLAFLAEFCSIETFHKRRKSGEAFPGRKTRGKFMRSGLEVAREPWGKTENGKIEVPAEECKQVQNLREKKGEGIQE